ncbi:MAG: hypothetical protein R3C03_07280 [Pirellulaceae bacterium]
MIGRQFLSILWLRWRLTVNQLRRGHWINQILGWAVFFGGCLIASSSFFGAYGAAKVPVAENHA